MTGDLYAKDSPRRNLPQNYWGGEMHLVLRRSQKNGTDCIG